MNSDTTYEPTEEEARDALNCPECFSIVAYGGIVVHPCPAHEKNE